ncbi:MAG: MtrB/PioB family decaheme-associated outer membrane protein, partial [Xanthomonadales bacterium]|nr:MtrB/PioB family decaheme-associated outer membrane protein [Xanthomonadales bacterium]
MKTFTRKLGIGLAGLLPLVLLSANTAQAQDEAAEPAIYACKRCVEYTGWRGTFDFGIGYVSDESLRFADYRGLDESGTHAAIDGDLHFKNLKGWYFDLFSVDTVHDNRRSEMRGGKIDRFEWRVGWAETPKYRGFGTQTPFLDVGSDNLGLPGDWVYSPVTSGMTALQHSLADAALKTQRKTLDAGATIKLGEHFAYKIDYQRQKKQGTRMTSAGLFNAANVPAPVDFVTDILETSLSFTSKRVQLQVGFMSSEFENEYSSLTWRNPFSSRSVNNYLQTALEPGNEFTQVNFSGAVVITQRIRFSGQAAFGELKQDDPFLPTYSTNPGFDDLILPRTSLGGKLDTSTYNLSGKLSANLGKGFSFTARGKVDERENKTPIDVFTPVLIDLLQYRDRTNRPFSYKREQYSADLRYRAGSAFRLSAGAAQKDMERTLQAVEQSEETTVWGEVKANPTLRSQLRFKFESAEREIDDYLQLDDGGPVDHPLMRKFNQADRDRDRVVADFDLTLTDRLGVNLSYFNARADYAESVIGLQESEEQSFTIDLNLAVGEKGSLYAFLTRDNIDSILRNASSVNAEPWDA